MVSRTSPTGAFEDADLNARRRRLELWAVGWNSLCQLTGLALKITAPRTNVEARKSLAGRGLIPHCVAPRCATDTYSGCIPAKRPDRTYGAGLQPCSTGVLLDVAPCPCDSGSHEGRRHIWGRCAGPRCKVEMAPAYECIRSCEGGPRHRHARALRAGRRPSPRDPHMAAFHAGQQKRPHGLPGVSVILRNHAWPPTIDALSWGSDTPAAYWSSAGDCSPVPRFAGSAGFDSPHDANHDARRVFGKRSE